MADNFIPLNQSTPVGGNWQNRNNQRSSFSHSNQRNYNQRRGYNNRRGGNNSQRNSSSYCSDTSNSFGNDRSNIDLYLHPSMLQDPWADLRRKLQNDPCS